MLVEQPGWAIGFARLEALAQRMLDLGYLLVLGGLFHARRQPSTFMSIDFATTQDARFWSDFSEARFAV